MKLILPNACSVTHFRLTDRDAIIANLADGRVQQWTLLIPFPYTQACAEEWLNTVLPGGVPDENCNSWAIRNPAGNQIGGIGFHARGKEPGHAVEIGYWLAQREWGSGIMTEAVRAVCDYGFQHMGIARITAAVFAGNDASARVLQKAGFTCEAPLLRKCYRKEGRFIDAALYAKVIAD